MRWNYTKTFALIALAQIAIYVPVSYYNVPGAWLDQTLARALWFTIIGIPIMAIADLVSWRRRARENRRAAGAPSH